MISEGVFTTASSWRGKRGMSSRIIEYAAACILAVTLQGGISEAHAATTVSLISTIPVGVGTSPQIAAINAAGTRVYVSNTGNNTVSVIATATNTVVTSIPVGTTPSKLVVSPDGTTVYVGNSGAGGGVSVISTATNTVTSTIATPSSVADIALTPNGAKLYVALPSGGVGRIVTATNTLTIISATECPEGLSITPDGSTLYVNYQCGGPGGSSGHDAIGVFSIATDTLTTSITGQANVGASNPGIPPNGNQFWESGSNACQNAGYDQVGCPATPGVPEDVINVFSIPGNSRLQSIGFANPDGVGSAISFSPDSSLAFIGGAGTLKLVDTTTFATTATLPIPASGSVVFGTGGTVAYAPVPSLNEVAVLAINTTILPSGTVGVPWLYAPPSSFGEDEVFPNAEKPYTNCQVVSGSLPPGFTFGLSSGLCFLSGTPTASGIYSFGVTVTDSTPTTSGVGPRTIAINPPPVVSFKGELDGWIAGLPLTLSVASGRGFAVQGGTPPYIWSALSMPLGMSIDPSTGIISGTLTTSGLATFTVQVSDEQNATAQSTYSFPVYPAISLTCSPAAPLPLQVGVLFTVTCSVSGTPPYTWSINNGLLPAGSTLSATSGSTVTVSGTPTTVETGTFSISVTDSTPLTDGSSPQVASQSFPYSVAPPAPTISGLSPYSATAGGPGFTLTVNGADFLSGCTVNWNGTPILGTLFVSPTLTAPVATAQIAAAGSALVTVSCSGVTSPSVTFPILAPTGQTWTQLAPTGGPPPARAASSAVFDSATQQMIIFGGGSPTVQPLDLNDVWTLNVNTNQWSQLSPARAAPVGRAGHSAVYDSAHSSMIIFGGGEGISSPCANDVWVLNNANSASGTPAWAPLIPTGSPPAPRIFHQAVYDPGSNRMIVFGGNNCFNVGPDLPGVFYNDVWVLTNANGLDVTPPAWLQLSPTGPLPTAREHASAVYDAASNTMIIFSGGGAAPEASDVWVLSNANGLGATPPAWTPLSVEGAKKPVGRSGHTATYDPVTNSMTVFGGVNSATNTLLSDTWLLGNADGSGGTPGLWTQLAPLGTIPPARTEHTAVYDPASNRMIIFSGSSGANPALNDVWTLSDAGGMPPSTTTLTSSPNPSTFGQSVTLTATVSPTAATGTVTFYDGAPSLATLLGTGALSGGTATLALSTLAVGTHLLTACYSGDANYGPSCSAPPLPQKVLVKTTTTLTSLSPNPSTFGQSVTLTATVSPTGATGTVTFYDGATVPQATLGTGTLSLVGTPTLTLSTLAVGTHLLTACYGGDANDGPTCSAVLTLTIQRATPTISWPSPGGITAGVPLGPSQLDATANVPGTFVYSPPAGTVLSAGIGQTLSVAFTPSDIVHYTSASASTTINVSPSTLTLSCSPATGPTQIGLAYSASCTATGGTAPYTFSGTLPAGLSLNTSTGAIGGTPTAGGAYSYTITVSDSETPPQTDSQNYSGKVTTPLTVAPSSLSFTYRVGDTGAPAPQSISVFSTPSGAAFTGSASGGDWLVVSAPGNASTPGVFSVSINTSGLTAAGTLNGTVTVTPAGGTPVNVAVTLAVLAQAPPQLSLSSSTDTFALTRGSAPVTGQVTVSNSGGGTLQFSATSDQPWLNAGGSGSATPLAPGLLGFSVNSAGLGAGLYTGHITITGAGSSGQASLTVTLVVSQVSNSIQLSQGGLNFTADTTGSTPPVQSFTVNNSGAGSFNWTAQAQTLSGGNWLSVTSGGVSIGGQTGSQATVSINQNGLTQGQYYGTINITASGAVNSPQSVSVLLTVQNTGTEGLGIVFSTGGVTLSGLAGSGTASGQVSLFNPSNTAGSYSTTTSVSQGSGWLSVSPAAGTLNPGSNQLTVQANLSSLASGVYTGTVTVAFNDGTTGAIQVVVIATAPASAVSSADTSHPRSAQACSGNKPSYLVPNFQQPVSQSSGQVAVPQSVQVKIVDDCDKPVTQSNGGGAQVTFSNKDTALNLQDIGGGVWEGTWTPSNAAGQVTVEVAAQGAGAGLSTLLGLATTTVAVLPASAAGAAQVTGVANAASASTATPQVVVPGGYVAIYGIYLASGGPPSAATLPLPPILNDAQLLLGGQSLPLSYAIPGQVNGLIPQDLSANASFPLVVQRGTTQSVPVQVTVAALQPGIFTVNTLGTGQGSVQIAGTTLLAAPLGNGSRPVQSGTEYLTIYCTGLGPVVGSNGELPPADGYSAALPAIYHTTASVTATIGGVNVPVTFAGLTPTEVALYQVNVQVPAGTPTGNQEPLVLTVTSADGSTTVSSNTVTVAVQ
jgi:uncharacterized protein (TIGR03437 family)